MCGPIALALPVHHFAAAKRITALLMYNLGRVITYTFIGLIFGLLGRRLHIAGLQQWLSVSMGVLIILFLVYTWQRKSRLAPLAGLWYQTRLQNVMGRLMRSTSMTGLMALGMLNGLLPCGMVYLAIAGALNTNHIWDGSLFMMMYGLGTLPAMLTLSVFGFMISIQVRNNMKRMMPYLLGIMAVLLILRGLNLGIPMISPEINHNSGTPVSCH